MAKRLLELEPTSLFGEKAILTSLTGREEISRPFEFVLNISSPNDKIKPEDVIGKPLAVRIDRGEAQPRYIHGYISHLWAGDFSMSEAQKSLPSRAYRVRIVPWLWFLTRAARCFIYLPQKEQKSIKEVYDEVIKRVKSYGHVETWNDAGGATILSQRKVEHCVQYRETDFNFLSRTLERYGVYYYFKHEATKHTLVLCDLASYPDAVEKEIRYAHSGGGQLNEDTINSWEHAYEFVSGKWEQTDYDFKKPSTSLKVNAPKHGSIPLKVNAGYELYDNPNDYMEKGDGKTEAERRMEEEEFRFNSVSAGSTCKTLTAGYCFKLTEHHSCPSEQGKSFLVTSITHSAVQPGPFTSQGIQAAYSNQFVCIPKETQFRPQRHTPQPLLSSIQTAVVVGPPGEEIHTDKYGRVKVQFHWDREGKRDDNTSCWIRVSQAHSGKAFGGIDIPRVGEEVVVSFLEGDLDRPLITGRVYHEESMPPFGLPAEKTRSGMKTKTYKGGGYNELSMDDTPGKEQIRIHGQYNLDTVIEHDETHTIHNNRTKKVDVDETMTIGNNQKLSVGVNKTVDVGTNHTETVGANQAVTIGANQTVSIAANKSASIGANESRSVGSSQSNNVGMMKNEMVGLMSNEMVGIAKSLNVGGYYGITVGAESGENVLGNKSVIVGGKFSENITGDSSTDVGGNLAIVVAGDMTQAASGNVAIQGKEVMLYAMTKLTLVCGASTIELTPAGINIFGPLVKINC